MSRTQWEYKVKPVDIPAPARPEQQYAASPRTGRVETVASKKAQEQWKKDTKAWKIQTGQISYKDVQADRNMPRGVNPGTIPGKFTSTRDAQEYAFEAQRESGAAQRVRTTARGTDSRTSAAGSQARFKRDRRGTVRGNVGSLRIR